VINFPAWARRARTCALAAVGVAAFLVVMAPQAASASGVDAPGSILYDKGGDLWQTTPDAATVHQTTHDGSTPTADNTGSSGYTVPSESTAGLIVAVRNQDYGSWSQGFLWVMDRDGRVIDKFKPPQFDLLPQFSGCPGPQAQFPTGILNATVAPDGRHVAYTATAVGNAPDCEAISEVGSWVVDIDGKNGHWLSADNSTADLEIGRWAGNTRLLIDRFDFGSIQNYYVDLPSYAATPWSAPAGDEFIDQAYLQPDVANGVLVTDGYSATSSAPVIRIWSTSGFNTDPTWKCEYGSAAHPGITTNENLNQPSLSPDGAYVAFEDYLGSAPDEAGEGIYLAPAAATLVSDQACVTATQTLFVQGAADPFWTAASITQLPPDTTAPTAALSEPSAPAIAAGSVKITWTGSDDSGIAGFDLRYRRAGYNGGFGAWQTPPGWQNLTGHTVTASGLQAGYDYCWSVRATDTADNTGAWSAPRCTAVALDDRALATSASGWHRGSGSAYYEHTVTTASRKGAVLHRTGATLDRVGVVATTCPTCGAIAVYVGRTRIGTVNLHAAATHRKVIKVLPKFRLRSGTVSVKVLSSGKTVAIDGLVLSRT
jgi:hypothetical protein